MWKRDGVNQKYLVGRLKMDKVPKDSDELNIVVFSNKNKAKDTHPDFRVYVSKSKEEREAESQASASEGQTSASSPLEEKSSEEELV
jgi:uncharacterized protein (DUF736 family)